ncbi:hypothetical protein NQZ68_004072 [Dissostichus eleginoides]|nr:hypothetical protein NQZ68_004072 [Dissostichus eleginoides]
MGHQGHSDHQEIKDQLGHLGKEDSLAHQVYRVRENQVKMVCQDSQACQVGKVIQDHQVCQESQDFLDLDQKVIKVWVDNLDLQDQKEIKATGACLVCLDHLDQMVHQVLLALWEPQDLTGLEETRVTLVPLGYLVRMVCLEIVESQDQEVHQDRVERKEMEGIKVYLVTLDLQDFPGQKDKVDYLVQWDLKVLKESLEWMALQDQLGLLVSQVQKEMAVFLVHQALPDPKGKWGHQGHRDNEVSLASLDHQAQLVHRFAGVLSQMGPELDGVKTGGYGKKEKYGGNGAEAMGASGLEMPAFTAVITTPFPPVGTPVVFDKLLYNGRQNYNPETGIFTCDMPGIYYFAYHVHCKGANVWVALMRNNEPL